MISRKIVRAAAHAAFALLVLAAVPASSNAQAAGSTFQKDRASILAMAGEFRVRFDMKETVPFVSDYTPLEPKLSGGHEVVRVIEDTGRVIRLQHLLVVGRAESPTVVKHWRQDWVYEPESVLIASAPGEWTLEPVPAAKRPGRWSQTVWQTDDSPRYGGLGAWRYDGGVARWTSDETRRPLARRDAIRHPVYDHYVGVNRHAVTPGGWVHEQDNAKRGARNGETITYVHEVVLNTYTRTTDFPVKAADDYWTKTSAYWAPVRAAWDAAIARGNGIDVREDADSGSEPAARLMQLASDLAAGRIALDAAVSDARQVIAAVERGDAIDTTPRVAAAR